MADNDKKPVINLVPAILTGTAALLAALTTMYVNVRNDIKSEAPPAAVAGPAADPAVSTQAQPQELRLRLQRIAVQEDGAVGTADWRFSVEADGEPLFAIEQEGMNSQGGRNVVVIDDGRGASAELELVADRPISVVVKGWRSGRLGADGEPLVFGEGTLSGRGSMAPVTVTAEDAGNGAFTFYFSATPPRD